jgi:hypothetical protein
MRGDDEDRSSAVSLPSGKSGLAGWFGGDSTR